MKTKNCLGVVSALCVAVAGVLHAQDTSPLVSRDIGDPTMNEWKPGEWVTCGGDVIALDERPSDPQAPRNAKALRLETRYGVRSFGGWNAAPTSKTLPGKPQCFEGWARLGNDKSWGMEFSFTDANTNEFNIGMVAWEDEGKFQCTTEWRRFRMKFPVEVHSKALNKKVPIAYPVKFEGVSQNNWGDKNNPEAVTRQFDLYDFRLFTDMSAVPESERPYEFSVSYPVIGNTFFLGEEKPTVTLSAGSWIGSPRTLKFKAKVTSAAGETKPFAIPDMKILDGGCASIALPFTEPGAYTLELAVDGLPKHIEKKSRYVVCLKPRELTPEEKQASPYGINVHGGGYVGYEKFARLGFVWLRDYAFTYSWMLNARGDGKYAGWPWYPKICKAAEDVGMLTLPCLMGAVHVEKGVKETDHPSFTPDNKWRRDMALIVSTFDNLSAFELDNETDGSMFTSLDGYGRYCQAFADIIHATRPDALAVSPGLAGIYVEQTQQLVEKGYFENMEVVNGHRYCGIDNPEQSKANLNTGMPEEKKTFPRGVWRHWKKAACADGKFRQLWLTEWGWDTRAGQIVTEIEQAAYMQRKWVLAMGNGGEKMI